MNLKNKILLLLYKTTKEGRGINLWKGHVTFTKKREESPYMEISRDDDQRHAYICNKLQLQNHSLTLIHKNKSLLSATYYPVHPWLIPLLLLGQANLYRICGHWQSLRQIWTILLVQK